MPELYAKLKDNWMLRGWSDYPYALVNWVTGELKELTALGFYNASFCNGQADFHSIAFLPQHRAVLEQFFKEGLAEPCPHGELLQPYQRYRTASNPLIRSIQWSITGYCNLQCRHCYMKAPEGYYGELPFETMTAIIDQLKEANIFSIALTGGEPFIRKEFLTIMELLTESYIGIHQIYTNATLITETHLQMIRRLGLSPAFIVSFDGCGTHDRMRGLPGCENRVVDTIKMLRAYHFKVSVTTVIDRDGIASLDATYNLMKNLDVSGWRIGTAADLGNWRGSSTALSLEEMVIPLAKLYQRWVNDGKPFYIKLAGFFSGSKNSAHETDFQYTPENFDCDACREKPSLQPDGTLVACPLYVDTVLYPQMPNIVKETLSSAWTNSFLREFTEQRKTVRLKDNPECISCPLFKKCGMGCRASAVSKTGNPRAKDPVACMLWKDGYLDRFHQLTGE